MAAEFISPPAGPIDKATISRAAKALAGGALVVFPTETVYGLAANAANGESVERLRELKGRAAQQPFTVHIGRRGDFADFVPATSPVANRLMRKGWPGPLTLVFPVDDPTKTKAHAVLSSSGAAAIYHEKTVGIRYPDHALAAALLAEAGVPIIASSANLGGQAPPLDAETVRETLGDRVDLILDGGRCKYRKSSTIVSLNGQGYRVLRAGVLDERTIKRLATLSILFVCTGNTCRSPMAEAIFKSLIAEKLGCPIDELDRRGIAIQSAGTMAQPGGPAAREAVIVCKKRGLDLSGHSARGLAVDMIRSADYIYTMGKPHIQVVRSLAPGDADKATALDPDEDIVDPLGGSQEDYEKVAEKLTVALRKRLSEVAI